MRFPERPPLLQLLWFVLVTLCAAFFRHPVYAAVSLVCSTLYLFSIRGREALSSFLLGLTLGLVYILLYGLRHRFGQPLFWGFTAQAVLKGSVQAACGISVFFLFSAFRKAFGLEKLFYVLRLPRASLLAGFLFSVFSRRRFLLVLRSRSCIGLGVRGGSLLQRCKNLASISACSLRSALESSLVRWQSMCCRGSTQKKRSRFACYRFGTRQRLHLLLLFALGTLMLVAVLLDQTKALYDPVFFCLPQTAGSFVFYTAYALLCLLPVLERR